MINQEQALETAFLKSWTQQAKRSNLTKGMINNKGKEVYLYYLLTVSVSWLSSCCSSASSAHLYSMSLPLPTQFRYLSVLHCRRIHVVECLNQFFWLNAIPNQSNTHVLLVKTGKHCIIYTYFALNPTLSSVITNAFKPSPDTEPDDLPGRWVIGSTAGKPRLNK